MIALHNIIKKYENRVVLNNINISFDKGLNIIIGRSGSGKTTLLNIIGTLENPTIGSVLIEGEDINTLNDKKINKMRNEKIGFVFQSFYLEPRYTVLENVALPLALQKINKNLKKEKCLEVLKKVDMLSFSDKLTSTLSGGEMQRVCIARAIINEPAIILADEPCGNLDYKTGNIIMDLLRQLANEGKCVILVTHNQEHLKYADRVIEILDGEIINEYIQDPSKGD